MLHFNDRLRPKISPECHTGTIQSALKKLEISWFEHNLERICNLKGSKVEYFGKSQHYTDVTLGLGGLLTTDEARDFQMRCTTAFGFVATVKILA